MPYERLDWGAHWRTMNENLIELVDLLPEEKLDWVPREAEWAAPTIFAYIAMARHMGPLGTPEAMARIGQLPMNCRTKDGSLVVAYWMRGSMMAALYNWRRCWRPAS